MEKATEEMKVSPEEPYGWLWNQAIECPDGESVVVERMALIVLISFYWGARRDAQYFENECWKLRGEKK